MSLCLHGSHLLPITILWLMMFSQAPPAPYPPIGIIDFYGLRTVAREDVQKILPFHEGEAFPPTPQERRKVMATAVEQLKSLPNVVDAQIKAVCCDQGKAILYVGIQ